MTRISRLWKATTDFGGIRPLLTSLQEAITRTAAGAARTSARLGSITGQIQRANEALDEMTRSAGALNDDIQRVSGSSKHTRTAAREMKEVTEAGRETSTLGAESARELEKQMATTVERIDRLFQSVQQVLQVSKVIDEIARQTQLLSVNASIEAARAGDQGRGFAVVAKEVGSLAENTARHTREIKSLLEGINKDLGPARDAISRSQALVVATALHAGEVGDSMDKLTQLADDVAQHMQSIAGSVETQRDGIEGVFSRLKAATESARTIGEDAQAITGATFQLSELTEATFQHFAQYDTGTLFHRALALGRDLGRRSGAVFDAAIDGGRCTLDDVLALEYREIRGAEIRSLAHLFDVRRVPQEGFTPPKYHTRYDAVVELDLQRVMEEIRKREPALMFALLIDLNAYGPIHNRRVLQGLDRRSEQGPRRQPHQALLHRQPRARARYARRPAPGRQLPRPRHARRLLPRRLRPGLHAPAPRAAFLVQTYARDTGAIVTVVTTPVYAKGRRWGATLLGWNAETAR